MGNYVNVTILAMTGLVNYLVAFHKESLEPLVTAQKISPANATHVVFTQSFLILEIERSLEDKDRRVDGGW